MARCGTLFYQYLYFRNNLVYLLFFLPLNCFFLFYPFIVYKQVGNHFGWRYAFWVEAILMFPFAILGFFMKPLQLKGAHSSPALISCSSITSFPITKLLVHPGFAPTDSEKALILETVVSEVPGTVMF